MALAAQGFLQGFLPFLRKNLANFHFFFFVVVFVTGWLLQLNSTGGGEFTVLGVVLGRILSAQLCK